MNSSFIAAASAASHAWVHPQFDPVAVHIPLGFAELAVRYAVLSDALADAVVAPWLDRIGLLEARAA